MKERERQKHKEEKGRESGDIDKRTTTKFYVQGQTCIMYLICGKNTDTI